MFERVKEMVFIYGQPNLDWVYYRYAVYLYISQPIVLILIKGEK